MFRFVNSLTRFAFCCHKQNQIQRIFPTGLPAAIGPYSPVTIYGNTVYVSGQIPLNPQTGNIQSTTIQGQAHQVMKNLQNALKGAGCTFSDVTKATILLTDMAQFGKVNEVYAQYFEKGKYPARVCYAVSGLPKNSLIEIDAIAYKPEQGNDCKEISCKSKTQHL